MNTLLKYGVATAVAGAAFYVYWRARHPTLVTLPPTPAPPSSDGTNGLSGPAGFQRVHTPVRGRLRPVSNAPLNSRMGASVAGMGGVGSLWDDIKKSFVVVKDVSLIPFDPSRSRLRALGAAIHAVPITSHIPLNSLLKPYPVPAPAAAPVTGLDNTGATPAVVWDGVPGDPGDPNLATPGAPSGATTPTPGGGGHGTKAPAPAAGGLNWLLVGGAAAVGGGGLFLMNR
jgi:hypothetical protein